MYDLGPSALTRLAFCAYCAEAAATPSLLAFRGLPETPITYGILRFRSNILEAISEGSNGKDIDNEMKTGIL